MSSDDLSSVLELGWQSSRETWQLLAPNEDGEFTTIGAQATGRAMDQLAYDLRRIGFGKPARLAYSIAFVLNSLANQSITFDSELAETTSQLVSVLAEMLLELEATERITIEEPVEIVEELKATWGLEFEPDVATSTFAEPVAEQTVEPELASDDSDLSANSEELVSASGSLLDRVLREGDFPHTASLGRIHHLATLVRDQILYESLSRPEVESVGYAEELFRSIPTISLNDSPSQVVMPEVADDDFPVMEQTLDDAVIAMPPTVLILDQSPFFRMLLTSVVESAGYQAFATEDLAAVAESQPWNMILCGLNNLTDADRDMLDRNAASWNAGIIAFEEADLGSSESIPLRRADIPGLLSTLQSRLGAIRGPVRQSA